MLNKGLRDERTTCARVNTKLDVLVVYCSANLYSKVGEAAEWSCVCFFRRSLNYDVFLRVLDLLLNQINSLCVAIRAYPVRVEMLEQLVAQGEGRGVNLIGRFIIRGDR